MEATIYSSVTGEIYVTMTGPNEASVRAQFPLYDDAVFVPESIDAKLWYLPNGVKTARPTMTLTASATTVPINTPFTVTGIPTGARVIGSGVDEVVNDGDIQWQSAVPGSFSFEFILFPFKPKVISLEVTQV